MNEISGWGMSDGIVDCFAMLEATYKRDAPKRFAAMLNDMAFTYREIAPRTLAARYTIRSPKFVKGSFYIMKRAAPGDGILGMSAAVTSNRLGEGRFSGWSEEEGGEQTRSAFYTLAARGGSPEAKVGMRYVLRGHDSRICPVVEATSIGSLARHRRLPAFVKAARYARGEDYAFTKSGREKRRMTDTGERTAKGGKLMAGTALGEYSMMATPLFIMQNPAGTKTLYRFAGDNVYSGRVEAVKIYRPPRRVKLWSWSTEAGENMMKYFPEDFLIKKYVLPMLGFE